MTLLRPLPSASRAARSRRGVAAVEFALTIGVMLTLLIAIVELSLLMQRLYVVSRVCRDACRIGSGITVADPATDGYIITDTAVFYANESLAVAGIDCGGGGCNATAKWEEQNGWMMLTVDVSVDYTPFTGLLPGFPDETETSFTMLTKQQIFD